MLFHEIAELRESLGLPTTSTIQTEDFHCSSDSAGTTTIRLDRSTLNNLGIWKKIREMGLFESGGDNLGDKGLPEELNLKNWQTIKGGTKIERGTEI
jgi:hypothetical protein